MWTFVTGYLISNIFEHFVLKLSYDNCTTKYISIFGIITIWLFQVHVRKDFNITGGKRFMVEQDFRNQFFTNIVKVICNFTIWFYKVTFFKLSIFFLLICYFFISIKKIILKNSVNFYLKYNSAQLLNFKIYVVDFSILFFLIPAILFFTFKKSFEVYSLYNLFIYFCMCAYFICNLIWLPYLVRVFINHNFKKIGLIFKLFTLKFDYYFLYALLSISVITNLVNFEILTNENFFQESIIKLFFFFFLYNF